MNRFTLALLALAAASTASIAGAQQTEEATVPKRVYPALQAMKVFAGIPMVYKRYSTVQPNAPGGKSSWGAQRSSAVVVQNAAPTPTDVTLCFYPSVMDSFSQPPSQTQVVCTAKEALPSGASWQLALDSLGFLGDGFHGSALVYAGQPVTAIAKHEFADGDMLAISMASAIKPGMAAGDAYVPTLYWDIDGQYGTHAMSTLFAQNLDSTDNDLTVKLFPRGESTPVHTAVFHLAPGRAAQIDVPNALAHLLGSFNGSATVQATRPDGSDGRVGTHVFELAAGRDNVIYNQAKAYAGFTDGSFTVNMATALCEAFGSPGVPGQSTAYAIQNITPVASEVTVVFKPYNVPYSMVIPGFSKASLQTCAVMGAGFSGSAVIYSDKPIVAMGKAFVSGQNPGTGTVTAFEGVEGGASRLSLPFVNWSTDFGYFTGAPRTNIALQNVGPVGIDGVKARYFDVLGNSYDVDLPGMAAGAKVNTSVKALADANTAASLKIYNKIVSDGLGSVEIIGPQGSQLSALARVQRHKAYVYNGLQVSEDYMAAQQKAKYVCRCEMTLPTESVTFSYFRTRTLQNTVGLCTRHGAEWPNNPQGIIKGNGNGDTCQACAADCRSNPKVGSKSLWTEYYQAAIMHEMPGRPPGANDPGYPVARQIDIDELIAVDPCRIKQLTVLDEPDSCKEAN